MSAVAIIQARMTSTRLPGKVLEPLGRSTVLGWVADRARMASTLDDVVIATSTDGTDDAVADEARRLEVRCTRGHLQDVLDRYRQSAEETGATEVIRLTADCPFVHPGTIDLALRTLREHEADYVSTNLDGAYPHGLDVEGLRAPVLHEAAAEATATEEREHVTLFVYRRPERYRCVAVPAPSWAAHPELRLTVDEPDDLRLARLLVSATGATTPASISTPEIVAALLADASLISINREVAHRHLR